MDHLSKYRRMYTIKRWAEWSGTECSAVQWICVLSCMHVQVDVVDAFLSHPVPQFFPESNFTKFLSISPYTFTSNTPTKPTDILKTVAFPVQMHSLSFFKSLCIHFHFDTFERKRTDINGYFYLYYWYFLLQDVTSMDFGRLNMYSTIILSCWRKDFEKWHRTKYWISIEFGRKLPKNRYTKFYQ